MDGYNGDKEERRNWMLSFNPHYYKSHLSSFGSEVLEVSTSVWLQKESRKLHQSASSQYVDYKSYIAHVPKTGDLLNIGARDCINDHQIFGAGMLDSPEGHNNINDAEGPSTLSKLLFQGGIHSNIKKLPEKEITFEKITSHNEVDWDNMFDSQALFLGGNNFNFKQSAATIGNKHTGLKHKPETITKNKLDERACAKVSSEPKVKKPRSPIIIEINKESGPVKKYKQKKITEFVPKKKLKLTENILLNGQSAMDHDTKSIRKKPYSKVVQDWLATVCLEESICDDTFSLKQKLSVIENTSPKSVQSHLINKGGVLKFSHTVDPSKYKICGKQVISNDKLTVPTECNTSTTEEIPRVLDGKTVLPMTKKIPLLETNKVEASITENTFKNSTYADITTLNNFPQKNNVVHTDKMKKKNLKFVVPIKSQVPIREILYNIDHIDKNTIHKIGLIPNPYNDITLTLIYRNEYSQLNCHHTDEDCIADGIVMGFDDDDVYYHISKTEIQNNDEIKSFMKHLLKTNTNKCCYDAKEVIIFLAECLLIHPTEIASGFIDAKVACFLMDPDNSPQTFSDVQKSINYTPEYTIATESNLQKTVWYITLLKACVARIEILLKEKSLWNIFVDMEMKLLPILAGLEIRGLRIDSAGLDSMKEIMLKKMKTVEQECYKSAGKMFQINSPLQLRVILYDDLKLDTKNHIKIKETIGLGAKSTSEAMLRSLADSHTLPKLVLEYRHLHKALATFITGIAQHVRDGIVRGTWLQTAAATGRIACNNPNLQAIPKMPFQLNLYPRDIEQKHQSLQLRSVYRAREGYVLLAADFQHVECRVFAHLAQDFALLDVFAKGGDFFKALAAKWLNKRQSEVTQEERERTKRMVYANMYGAGTKKLMDILNISYDQTLTIVSSFNRTFPSLKSFGQRIVERCQQQDGALETLCGRRRNFHNIFSANFALKSQAERQAVNFMIQGSAADLCKSAMLATDRSLRGAAPPADCHLVLQIHDELVWEAAESDLERITELVKAAMESCGRSCGLDLALPVAVSSGRTWADLHSG